MYCMDCGTENSREARFCAGCGKLLRLRTNEERSAERRQNAGLETKRKTATAGRGGTAGWTVLTIIGLVVFVFSFMTYNSVAQTYEYRMGYLDSSDQAGLTIVVLFMLAGIVISVIGGVRLFKKIHSE